MRALICGVSGQDGSYLAKLLLDKGYEVWGTSRDAQVNSFRNLFLLGIKEDVSLCSMAPTDFRSVLGVIERCAPQEIYFLSGQSSVGLSFEQPSETLHSFVLGILNILEAVRLFDRDIKIYHASSSECFGDVGVDAAVEETAFRPRSPYGVAKASAHWLVANYRESYGIFACNGVLFNHESPLRSRQFVTKKIVDAAIRISRGYDEKLHLGRLDIVRDWGWAPEYVDAMWRILQSPEPKDYVIATGVGVTLECFVAEVFNSLGLLWRDHVVVDSNLYRPTDIQRSVGDAGRAKEELNWSPRITMPLLAKVLVEQSLMLE